MKLIMVRHGETEENAKLILMGWMPGVLTAEGIKQAEATALQLKEEKIDAVYSSDLARASDTAEHIIKFHMGVRLILAKELRERYLGELQGVQSETREVQSKRGFGPTKTGETLEELQERVSGFLAAVYRKHPDQTVLFVCHTGTILALLNSVEARPASEMAARPRPKNGEIITLEINFKK